MDSDAKAIPQSANRRAPLNGKKFMRDVVENARTLFLRSINQTGVQRLQ
jgi:hypothetical protein